MCIIFLLSFVKDTVDNVGPFKIWTICAKHNKSNDTYQTVLNNYTRDIAKAVSD